MDERYLKTFTGALGLVDVVRPLAQSLCQVLPLLGDGPQLCLHFYQVLWILSRVPSLGENSLCRLRQLVELRSSGLELTQHKLGERREGTAFHREITICISSLLKCFFYEFIHWISRSTESVYCFITHTWTCCFCVLSMLGSMLSGPSTLIISSFSLSHGPSWLAMEEKLLSLSTQVSSSVCLWVASWLAVCQRESVEMISQDRKWRKHELQINLVKL